MLFFLSGGQKFESLWHRRKVGLLSMLYKIRLNPDHYLYRYVPDYRPFVRVTRRAVASHPFCLKQSRCCTNQFARSFFPAAVCLWNDLGCEVFDGPLSLGLFKSRVNCYLRSV